MKNKTPLIADNEIPTADPTEVLLCYDRFAYKMANHYKEFAEMISSVSLEDLEQAARIGLLLAQSTYDPSAGMKFISWAAFFMSRELKRAVGFRGEGMKTPPQIPLSLDAPLSADDPNGDTLLDTIPDEGETLEERLEREARAEALHEAINKLCESQKEIIDLSFFQQKEISEIAKITGKTERKVSTTKRSALITLRDNVKLRLNTFGRTDFYNIHVGVQTFNRTWTSSTELGALKRIAQYEALSAGIDDLIDSYEA